MVLPARNGSATSSRGKCKDSTAVDFNRGNRWQEIGVWSLAPQPGDAS